MRFFPQKSPFWRINKKGNDYLSVSLMVISWDTNGLYHTTPSGCVSSVPSGCVWSHSGENLSSIGIGIHKWYIAYFKICSTHLAIYRINDFVWRMCGLLLTALACFSAGTFGDCWPTLTLATWHDLGKLTCTIFHRFSCPKASSNCLPCCPSLWYEHYELFAPHKIVFCPHFFRHIPLPCQPFGDPSNFLHQSSSIIPHGDQHFHQHFLAFHQISSRSIGSPEISAPISAVELHGSMASHPWQEARQKTRHARHVPRCWDVRGW